MEIKDDLSLALSLLDEKKVDKIVKERIENNIPALEILKNLQDGLFQIGNLFEKGELFVPELIYGGMIMKKQMDLLKPLLKGENFGKKGKVVLGTVYGDIHDIGKDIVKTLLEGAGYEVVDLGTNVKPELFVESAKNNNIRIVGLSALLTISFESIAKTVEAFIKEGIRDKVKIMVGGAPVTDLVARSTGCDFYGKDAYEGLKYVENFYKS